MDAIQVPEDYEMISHRIMVMAFVWFYFLVGCNPSPNPGPGPKPDPDKTIEVQAEPFNDDQDIWALAAAHNTGGDSPSPNPAPDDSDKPKVGDTCPECKGRGTSGDGIQPCNPCRGDGKVDDGDPILSFTSLPQETSSSDDDEGEIPDDEEEEDEVPPEPEYLPREEFQKWQTEDYTAKSQELVQTNEQLTARVNELQAMLKQQETVASEESKKVLDLTARILALESKAQQVAQPAASQVKKAAAPAYWYRVVWQGMEFTWDQSQKAFISRTGKKIAFPSLGPIEEQSIVKICNDPENPLACEFVPVKKVPMVPPRVIPYTPGIGPAAPIPDGADQIIPGT